MPCMNKEAFFADTAEDYVIPPEPEEKEAVRFRFRTLKDDAERVDYVIAGGEPARMNHVFSDTRFDYYEITVNAGTGRLSYCFRITSGQEVLYYDTMGPSEGHDDDYNFCVIPGFHVPEWTKGCVMYQILVDRFRNGNTENDVREGEYIYLKKPVHHVGNMDERPAALDVGNFHGGDLRGILDKLDYLKSLGVGALYLNPVFKSPSNHKYDVEDYDCIDPHIAEGDDPNAFFSYFVKCCHDKGIRVILDGVFNHCSDRNRLAEQKDREYWWDNLTLPKFNYERRPELKGKILEIAGKWMKPPYEADGWRLDVAADLGHSRQYNHEFWRDFRRTVKEAGKDRFILAEHYGDPREWLSGKEWDSVMNYDGFMDPLSFFLTGMEKHSDYYDGTRRGDGWRFETEVRRAMSRMNGPSVLCAMNELDNHDHSRFLTRTNRTAGRLPAASSEEADTNTDRRILMQAAVIQMTLPGAPTIYYGDEAGVCGWTDPDSRRAFPWGKEDTELQEFYRALAAFHNAHECIRKGSLIWLRSEWDFVSYARVYGEDYIIAAVNTSDEEKEIRIPSWKCSPKENDRQIRIAPHGYYYSE